MSLWRRFSWIALLCGLSAGPTPGAIGSCNEEDEPVQLRDYCMEREALICERRRRRDEFDDPDRGYRSCRVTGNDLCRRRFWPRDCRPTQRQADACLNALRSIDTLQTPAEELDECSRAALCTARTEGPPLNPTPEGGAGGEGGDGGEGGEGAGGQGGGA